MIHDERPYNPHSPKPCPDCADTVTISRKTYDALKAELLAVSRERDELRTKIAEVTSDAFAKNMAANIAKTLEVDLQLELIRGAKMAWQTLLLYISSGAPINEVDALAHRALRGLQEEEKPLLAQQEKKGSQEK